MNSAHMLSAQRVKLHGMTSSKWTTPDKITQYKGLVNLYTRDKNIVERDNKVAENKQAKELKNIQRDIIIKRNTLKCIIEGDKHKLKNILANHNELKLVLQNASPQNAIDMVYQLNFNKRKTIDKLKYKMKLKVQELKDLKLKCGMYEDAVEALLVEPVLSSERDAKLLTAQIHDAMLKKEAAIYIKNCYRKMIAIMKKDSIYFDSILLSITEDSVNQGMCMINATKQGQLGTEYLDDRRREYQFLENIVRGEMKFRDKDFAVAQQTLDSFTKNIKNLTRGESEINFIRTEDTSSCILLQNELGTVQGTLLILQNNFSSSSVSQLYHFLKEQFYQKERLAQLRQKSENMRDSLLRTIDHVTLKRVEVECITFDSKEKYSTHKLRLLSKITELVAKKREYQLIINNRKKLLVEVWKCLKHLQCISKLLSVGNSLPSEIKEDENDSFKIILALTDTFTKLVNNLNEYLPSDLKTQGYALFEAMMRDRIKLLPREYEYTPTEKSLVESVLVDPKVPTYEDIKKESTRIVARGLEQLRYQPPPSRRRYKFIYKFS